MRRLTTIFFAACLYGFVMTPANAVTVTENITNGGFETGNLTPWSCTGATSCDTTSSISHTGTYSMVGSSSGVGILSQTIATTVGTTYDFSVFSFTDVLDVDDPLRYSLDGGAVMTIAQNFTYSLTTDSFVASGSTAVISFFFNTGDGGGSWFIDDVSVTNIIPLPAALPMFLLALAGLGFVARQRRQA